MNEKEFEIANSYRFPITILERFFNFVDVREKWGIEFDGIKVNILSNKESFYTAFAELIKRIINKSDDNINTRFNKEHLDTIIDSLPTVIFDTTEDSDENEDKTNESKNGENDDSINKDKKANEKMEDEGNSIPPSTHLKGNPNRNRIVLPIYNLNTDSFRLLGVFNEFKSIPISRYPNNIASSLRVFLDLAIFKYIETEGLERVICAQYKDELRHISLKKRLEYLKTNNLTGKSQTIVNRLINPSQQYSLDVLNGYIHNQDSHYMNKQFLNGFWDFLFPLFEVLLDIREDK